MYKYYLRFKRKKKWFTDTIIQEDETSNNVVKTKAKQND